MLRPWQGQPTRLRYDEFGRFISMYRPHPGVAEGVNAFETAVVRY